VALVDRFFPAFLVLLGDLAEANYFAGRAGDLCDGSRTGWSAIAVRRGLLGEIGLKLDWPLDPFDLRPVSDETVIQYRLDQGPACQSAARRQRRAAASLLRRTLPKRQHLVVESISVGTLSTRGSLPHGHRCSDLTEPFFRIPGPSGRERGRRESGLPAQVPLRPQPSAGHCRGGSLYGH
jgi:hypothetical protein